MTPRRTQVNKTSLTRLPCIMYNNIVYKKDKADRIMSDYKHVKGKIVLEPRVDDESDEHYFERVTGQDWATTIYTPHDLSDALYWHRLCKKFVIIGGELYRFLVYDEIEDEDSYCSLLRSRYDASIDFDCRYYNGGTCLEEVLEEEMIVQGFIS